MKLTFTLWLLFVGLWGGPNLWAAPQEVILQVEGMTCGLCPITVKSSLKKVDGVSQVIVSLKEKSAVVWYDDAKAQVRDLIQATTQAGYPSKPAGKRKQFNHKNL